MTREKIEIALLYKIIEILDSIEYIEQFNRQKIGRYQVRYDPNGDDGKEIKLSTESYADEDIVFDIKYYIFRPLLNSIFKKSFIKHKLIRRIYDKIFEKTANGKLKNILKNLPEDMVKNMNREDKLTRICQ